MKAKRDHKGNRIRTAPVRNRPIWVKIPGQTQQVQAMHTGIVNRKRINPRQRLWDSKSSYDSYYDKSITKTPIRKLTYDFLISLFHMIRTDHPGRKGVAPC